MPTLSRRARRVIPLAVVLTIAACLLTVVGVRAVRAYQELRYEQRVRSGDAGGVMPWMTIPFIAQTYAIPEQDLYNALGIVPTERQRRAPLKLIALHDGRDLNADIATLNAVVDAKGTKPSRPVFPPRPPTPRPATPRATPGAGP